MLPALPGHPRQPLQRPCSGPHAPHAPAAAGSRGARGLCGAAPLPAWTWASLGVQRNGPLRGAPRPHPASAQVPSSHLRSRPPSWPAGSAAAPRGASPHDRPVVTPFRPPLAGARRALAPRRLEGFPEEGARGYPRLPLSARTSLAGSSPRRRRADSPRAPARACSVPRSPPSLSGRRRDPTHRPQVTFSPTQPVTPGAPARGFARGGGVARPGRVRIG